MQNHAKYILKDGSKVIKCSDLPAWTASDEPLTEAMGYQRVLQALGLVC